MRADGGLWGSVIAEPKTSSVITTKWSEKENAATLCFYFLFPVVWGGKVVNQQSCGFTCVSHQQPNIRCDTGGQLNCDKSKLTLLWMHEIMKSEKSWIRNNWTWFWRSLLSHNHILLSWIMTVRAGWPRNFTNMMKVFVGCGLKCRPHLLLSCLN